MNVTFLIPVLDERDTLERLADGIMRHTAPHEARILFIDDGSTDGSYEAMCRLRDRHDNVGVIRLRRNFGKSTALAVGFDRAEGDVVITMDGDLQDDPKEIPRFLAALENGHDVVVGWKKVRNDPWHKTLPSRVYNGLVAWLFKLDLHDVN
ncbi:MAG: glycosyltransferase, partial [Nitrospiraceae bacterium]|nr:glycosyltransferase [Nitrospiraceae bacterium]